VFNILQEHRKIINFQWKSQDEREHLQRCNPVRSKGMYMILIHTINGEVYYMYALHFKHRKNAESKHK